MFRTNYSFLLSGNLETNFGISAEILRCDCQTCILYVQRKDLRIFLCKILFSNVFGSPARNFRKLGKKSLSVGKSCFLRVRNIVLIKFFHLKKSFDCFETLIEKILDCERFKKWLSVKKFRLGTQNCNLSVFAKTLIFRSLCDNFPDFWAKIFVRVMKYAFYGGLE